MPYKSKAQQRKFHVDPELKKLAPKWDDETKATKKGFKGLPEKLKKRRKKSTTTKKKQTKAKDTKKK